MATSLLLMASDPVNTHEKTLKPLCEETKTEPSRNRGRRANGKGRNQKKQPQRGLGVAQLESLRIQETLKKMTQTTAVPVPPFFPDQHHVLQCRPPPPVFNGNTIPVSGPGQANGNMGGFNALGGGGWLVTNRVNMVDSYGFVAPVWSHLVGSPLENSKELSSMPNVHSESERCDVCLKKKRFNEDNVIGSNTGRDKPSDIWPINGPDFLGLSPQQATYLIGETSGSITRTTRHVAVNSFASRNRDEFVEVVAVHRKENSMSGRVFMEYEFFPGKDGRGTASKELELPTVGSLAVGGEASSSSITTTAYGDTASNSIDLSLKL